MMPTTLTRPVLFGLGPDFFFKAPEASEIDFKMVRFFNNKVAQSLFRFCYVSYEGSAYPHKFREMLLDLNIGFVCHGNYIFKNGAEYREALALLDGGCFPEFMARSKDPWLEGKFPYTKAQVLNCLECFSYTSLPFSQENMHFAATRYGQ